MNITIYFWITSKSCVLFFQTSVKKTCSNAQTWNFSIRSKKWLRNCSFSLNSIHWKFICSKKWFKHVKQSSIFSISTESTRSKNLIFWTTMSSASWKKKNCWFENNNKTFKNKRHKTSTWNKNQRNSAKNQFSYSKQFHHFWQLWLENESFKHNKFWFF